MVFFLRKKLNSIIEKLTSKIISKDKVSISEIRYLHLALLKVEKDPEKRLRSLQTLSDLREPLVIPAVIDEMQRHWKKWPSVQNNSFYPYSLLLKVLTPFLVKEDGMSLDDQVRIRDLSENQKTLSRDLHSYLIAYSMGADPTDLNLHRFILVSIYLIEDDFELIEKISKHAQQFVEELNFEFSDEYPPISGSWFKRWFARTKEVMTKPQVEERLRKAERALELVTLHEKQASVDNAQATAIAQLISSLEKTSSATLQIGSILLVKTKKGESSQIHTRTLTPKQMIFLENNQNVLKNPTEILKRLEDLNGEVEIK